MGVAQQDGIDTKTHLSFAGTYEGEVTGEDGESKVKVQVNEGDVLWKAMETGKSSVGGVWLGGQKYTITRAVNQEINNVERRVIFANQPQKGVVIAQTEWCFCIGHFDEKQNTDGRNCQLA